MNTTTRISEYEAREATAAVLDKARGRAEPERQDIKKEYQKRKHRFMEAFEYEDGPSANTKRVVGFIVRRHSQEQHAFVGTARIARRLRVSTSTVDLAIKWIKAHPDWISVTARTKPGSNEKDSNLYKLNLDYGEMRYQDMIREESGIGHSEKPDVAPSTSVDFDDDVPF